MKEDTPDVLPDGSRLYCLPSVSHNQHRLVLFEDSVVDESNAQGDHGAHNGGGVGRALQPQNPECQNHRLQVLPFKDHLCENQCKYVQCSIVHLQGTNLNLTEAIYEGLRTGNMERYTIHLQAEKEHFQ